MIKKNLQTLGLKVIHSMQIKYFIPILILHLSFSLSGQTPEYVSPVKIPVFLSGNFAELRSNHFHSGIDIKTQGIIGIPIYSAASGFISRIVVSPTGYGLALYIEHPNGTTSVYGHLESFRDDIARYVKSKQYEQESFRVDLPVSKSLFPVKQGEFIAKSGNTGSTGGPHLHFEIRDTKTEEPVNPLFYPFPVADKIAPHIYSLMITPMNEFAHVNYQAQKAIFPVEFSEGKFRLKNNPVVPVYGVVGFAVQANDFYDGSHNRCGIYSMRMFWDGELYFSFRMDRFSFDESRYINSHIDYEELINTKQWFHKAWQDPGNRLSIYDYIRDSGLLRVTDGNIHIVRIELSDLHGNLSILEFRVESKSHRIVPIRTEYTQLLRYDKANRFSEENITIDFSENTFYNDVEFMWKQKPASENLFSDIHVIHQNTVPLHNSAKLSIKADKLEKELQEKALLVTVDTLTGKISSAGGSYNKGFVTANIRSFGNYAIALDTIAPRIIPLSLNDKSALTESNRIRFRITDDLSGIKEYTGILDGKWALFEYDAKTNMIVHYFDSERFELEKRHQLTVKVSDNKGNENIHETSFWK